MLKRLTLVLILIPNCLWAALPQSRPLPSEKDFEKAAERLEKDWNDKRANQKVGMYLAFVERDYKAAWPYLKKSSSSVLKKLAQHELDPEYTKTPKQKVAMGDEWVKSVRGFRALRAIFNERAGYWYLQVWPNADTALKDQLRKRGRVVAAPAPPGKSKNNPPNGWIHSISWRGTVPEVDGTIARTGSHSAKVLPPKVDPTFKKATTLFGSVPFPVEGDEVDVSAYLRSEGNDHGGDRLYIWFFDKNGKNLGGSKSVFLPLDVPFWTRVSIKTAIPENTARCKVEVWFSSKTGTVWIDDVSVRVAGGKNLVVNPSFER